MLPPALTLNALVATSLKPAIPLSNVKVSVLPFTDALRSVGGPELLVTVWLLKVATSLVAASRSLLPDVGLV